MINIHEGINRSLCLVMSGLSAEATILWASSGLSIEERTKVYMVAHEPDSHPVGYRSQFHNVGAF
jgi:hypothetical protein